MSEPIQIILGALFLIAIFVLTRLGIMWKMKRAAGAIIKGLAAQGAIDVVNAVDLPYSKPNPLRIGMRDYRYKALEYLIEEGVVGKTDDGKYYLRIQPAAN